MTAAELVEANAPFWAAEAELCRTYFDSADRTLATDLRWIARQAAKELVDGVMVRTDSDQAMREEQAHLDLFARAYDQLRLDREPALSHAVLTEAADWPANTALRDLRREHRERHGTIGWLAGIITEGGAATLFREGASLAGRGGVDDIIAVACAGVLVDEERHARDAIADLTLLDPGLDGWQIAIACTVEQSRQRLWMRAEQFGYPVAGDRFAELLDHGADPSSVRSVFA